MDATTAIAVYAAVVATVSGGWQVYTWRRDRQTRIDVSVTNAFLTFDQGLSPMALITAVNRSRHPVRVESMGFDVQDESGRTLVITAQPPGSTLPGEVRPQDSGKTWIEQAELASRGFDLTRPLAGWVNDATGKRHRSKRVTLRA